MPHAAATNGDEVHIRAVVFQDGEIWIAQCIEYDIAVQAPDVPTVLDKLQLTIDAEHAMCDGQRMCDRISPAPNYYHHLWDQKSSSWMQQHVAGPLEIAFLKVA